MKDIVKAALLLIEVLGQCIWTLIQILAILTAIGLLINLTFK